MTIPSRQKTEERGGGERSQRPAERDRREEGSDRQKHRRRGQRERVKLFLYDMKIPSDQTRGEGEEERSQRPSEKRSE